MFWKHGNIINDRYSKADYLWMADDFWPRSGGPTAATAMTEMSVGELLRGNSYGELEGVLTDMASSTRRRRAAATGLRFNNLDSATALREAEGVEAERGRERQRGRGNGLIRRLRSQIWTSSKEARLA
eukprot:1073520-Pleurochrysis_carterae.AAC.1